MHHHLGDSRYCIRSTVGVCCLIEFGTDFLDREQDPFYIKLDDKFLRSRFGGRFVSRMQNEPQRDAYEQFARGHQTATDPPSVHQAKNAAEQDKK